VADIAGVFTRSWEITKLSFGVIKQDKELLVFPVLAGIFSLIFMVLMVFPFIIPALMAEGGAALAFLEYLFIFLIYLGLVFIATFFNVCVVYTAKTRFAGKNATFGESIGFAFKKIHLIFMWSLLAATVGLILKILDNMARQQKGIGAVLFRIMNAILGLAWSIVTIFVVPAMVYHDLSPIEAIKRSVKTLKKTWGESLIRHFGLGLVQSVFTFVGIIILIPVGFLVAGQGLVPLLIVIGIGILYIVLVSLIFSVANTIFNTALYTYADTGKIPGGYSKDIMKGAFKSRKSSFLGKGIVGR
jgi:hypothetical protein